MNFWKRLGAGLITFTLVLGLLPAVTIALPTALEEAPTAGSKTLYAGFRLEDAKVDGVLDEAEWALSGKLTSSSGYARFGALYSTATLYMAYEVPAGNSSITIKINGRNVGVSPVVNTKTGYAELAVSLSDAGIRVSGFDMAVPLSINLGNMSWSGSIVFTSLRPRDITGDLGELAFTNNGAETVFADNTLNMYTTTYAGGNGGTNLIVTKFGSINDAMKSTLQSIDNGNVSMELDCLITDMPAYPTHYAISEYWPGLVNGLVLHWTGRRKSDVKVFSDENAGIVSGITNTVDDGLVLSIRDADYEIGHQIYTPGVGVTSEAKAPRKVVLGKKLGEPFHLRMDYSAREKILDIYVDSVFIERLTDITYGTAYGISTGPSAYGMAIGLYFDGSNNPYTTVEDCKTNVSVSNLRIGTYTTEANALDTISFDTIKQDNYSTYSVSSDLFLPTFIPGLPSIKLKWASSNPDVIDPDGTVKPAEGRTTSVTLTAEVRGNDEIAPKSFTVMVPPKDPQIKATLAEDGITLNGKMDELAWATFENFTPAKSGLPSGTIGATWSTGYLHLAVRSSNATGLWLRLNRREVYIDLNKCTATKDGIKIVKGDVWEVSIPIDKFYIRLKDYNTAYPLKAELRNSSGSTPIDEVKAVCFSGDAPVRQRFYPSADSNGMDAPASEGRYQITSNAAITEGVDRFYIGGVRHYLHYSGTATINVDYKFDSLPVSDGKIGQLEFTEDGYSKQLTANGFYQMVGFQNPTTEAPQTDKAGYLMFAAIYRPAEESSLMLKLCSGLDARGNVRAEKVFDLGVGLGETFRLSLTRNLDDSVEAYINGRYLGTMEQACGFWSYDCLNAINFRYYNEDDRVGERLTFTAENITTASHAYSSILNELTLNDVLNDYPDLHDLRESIVLPKKAGEHIIRSLQWVTSDDSVIDKEGNIKRTEKGQRQAVLTLKVGGSTVWSRKVIVPALDIKDDPSPDNITAGYTTDSGDDAITIDGKLQDMGWVMSGRILNNKTQQLGEFGAQWNRDYLYLAIDTGKASSLAVQVNGVAIPLAGDSSVISRKSGTIREYKIPMSYIGMTEIAAYDTMVPITVTLDRNSYIGNLKLTSIDWWKALNSESNQPVSSSVWTIKQSQANMAKQKSMHLVGADAMQSGFHLWDDYNPGGENFMGTKNEIVMWQEESGFQYMRNRDQTIFIEFDFEARSMPEYEINDNLSGSMWGSTIINYGFFLNVADTAVWKKDDTERWSNVYMLGIINSGTDEDSKLDPSERNDGLYLNLGTDRNNVLRLNRYVGDTFRLGLAWHTDDSLTIYIDGEKAYTFDHCSAYLNKVLTEGIRMATYRKEIKPTSPEESIDILITNMAFGASLPENPVDVLQFSNIAGANTEGAGNVVADLVLPSELSNGIFASSKITWSSSNPALISHTGKVTRPETGMEQVTLTATDEKGNKKSFDIVVLGLDDNNNKRVLVVDADNFDKVAYPDHEYYYGYRGDMTPAEVTALPHVGGQFKLDYRHNAIVYNLRVKQRVNVVRLRDSDEYSRLTRESLQLWISDDNKTWTEVTDYKLLHRGTDWYLYDFDVETVYVKARYTHVDGDDSDFINVVDDMIYAYYEDVFGSEGGLFQATTYTLKNNLGKDARDQAFTISKASLGISNTSDNSLRFMLDGKYLLHYVDGSNVVVRIPDLKKDASVKLTVLYGNNNAMDVSNKEDVYEVTYGTKESYDLKDKNRLQQIVNLPAGMKLANGTVLEQDRLIDMEGGYFTYSHDGGYSWTKANTYPDEITDHNVIEQGGYILDHHAGRLYCVIRDYTKPHLVFIYSDDGGINWRLNYVLEQNAKYKDSTLGTSTCIYTSGLVTSVYDGTGPNVDMVIMECTGLTDYPTGSSGAAICLYTEDAGKTWKRSYIALNLPSELEYEDGVTESDVLENENGVLVAYCRYQTREGNQMAYATSASYGKLWSATKVSHVYNVNSQPTMEKFFESETPVMLWSGNNSFNASSQQRMPISVAVSYDGLYTWKNIQNIFAETPLEDYVGIGVAGAVTNPSMELCDGALCTGWANNNPGTQHMMRVKDFENYLFRTKGAYDSFEHGTTQYEGWVPYAGYGNISSLRSTDGNLSMKLSDGAILSRYIPYLQNGTVSFDLYLEADSNITIDLQSAFVPRVGICAPMSIAIKDLGLYVGDQIETGYKLREGWNSIKFSMELADNARIGQISINGDDPLDIPLGIEAGDYVTYICVRNETDGVFLDNFLVETELDAEIYSKKTSGSNGGINAPTGDATNLPLLIVITTLSLVALITLAGKMVYDRKRKTRA